MSIQSSCDDNVDVDAMVSGQADVLVRPLHRFDSAVLVTHYLPALHFATILGMHLMWMLTSILIFLLMLMLMLILVCGQGQYQLTSGLCHLPLVLGVVADASAPSSGHALSASRSPSPAVPVLVQALSACLGVVVEYIVQSDTQTGVIPVIMSV